jgi:hypothetical protein
VQPADDQEVAVVITPAIQESSSKLFVACEGPDVRALAAADGEKADVDHALRGAPLPSHRAMGLNPAQ